jgi:proteasome lid subunit RPN8/RPN11
VRDILVANTLYLTGDSIEQMSGHATKVFPEECCGIVLEREGHQIVKTCRNIQDEKWKEDATGGERTAETAYHIHHDDLFDVVDRLVRREGYEILAIYHSHPRMKAYFSQTDRSRAVYVWDNKEEPIYPGVSYIVISVFPEGVKDMKVFHWDERESEFVEIGYVRR